MSPVGDVDRYTCILRSVPRGHAGSTFRGGIRKGLGLPGCGRTCGGLDSGSYAEGTAGAGGGVAVFLERKFIAW